MAYKSKFEPRNKSHNEWCFICHSRRVGSQESGVWMTFLKEGQQECVHDWRKTAENKK